MAKIKIEAYRAKVDGAWLSVMFDIGGRDPSPMPTRVIETTKTAAVLAEIAAMKAEGEQIEGKPTFVLSARVIEGRAPSGFKDATRGYTQVNC